MNTTADISFVVDSLDAPGAFKFDFVHRMDNKETLLLQPHSVPVYDIRSSFGSVGTEADSTSGAPTIEQQGWCVRSWPYQADFSGTGWEEQYCKDAGEWLKNLLGAKKVNVFNHAVRKRQENPDYSEAEAMGDSSKLQPVTAAHIDHNKTRGFEEVQKLLGVHVADGEQAPKMAVFNIWRPLRGPVIDAPLAFCDASTLPLDDRVETMDQYGGGYYIRYSPEQKWYYLKNQMPEEVHVFCCYDSSQEQGCVPHSAFLDKARLGEEGLKPRQSIELRCAVLF